MRFIAVSSSLRLFGGIVALGLAGQGTQAQELEPRAYSANPVGVNFIIAALTHQRGDVFTDPTLPIEDVSARISVGTVGYGRTFGLFGRQASATLGVPYVRGSAEGTVFEAQQEVTRTGLGDSRLRLAANLLGGPALSPREFAAHRPATTLGVSLLVVAPTGEYDPARLVNIGSNRWSFKPEVGASFPAGSWLFEGYVGAWLFTTNDDYFGGQQRTQDPVGTFQAHVSYTFRRSLWIAGDATFYSGGRSELDGVPKDDLQENSRVGLTGSLPIGDGHSVKLSIATGASTRVGQDFDTIGVAYQFVWFDKPRP